MRDAAARPFGGLRPVVWLGRSAATLALVLVLTGQSGRRFGGDYAPNIGYTGQFTYARIRYTPAEGAHGRRERDVKWDHDYPASDRHFPLILRDVTSIFANTLGSNIYSLNDPDLFKHPWVYLCEAGFLTLTDSEARNMREYLLKGGFIVFDDFVNEAWDNFEGEMKRVLPEYRPIRLDQSHPIFHTFFEMKRIDFPHPYYRDVQPVYYGFFESNDPTKRMLAIVNYNNDVSEYWEWSDTDQLPVDITNEAYQLGVNYAVYAITH